MKVGRRKDLKNWYWVVRYNPRLKWEFRCKLALSKAGVKISKVYVKSTNQMCVKLAILLKPDHYTSNTPSDWRTEY
jgi:hypothetical protein